MGNSILHETLNEFQAGREIRPDSFEAVFDALITETDDDLLRRVFIAWVEKDLTSAEISGLAAVMRSRMIRIRPRHEVFVDSVGTGGSPAKTFNVSTPAAFVIAGADVPVAKHGNRAATSKTGSADALSELGINADIEPKHAEHCLNETGICFMFAPRFHRLSPLLSRVRRELGFPTVFNCLGPLCNPAGAPHQLIGVWRKDMVSKTAEAVARLGTKRSWVVHGEDGLDEVTVRGRTFIAEVEGRDIRYFELTPDDFGVANGNLDIPNVKTPAESAQIIREVIQGQRNGTAAEKLVLVNAAAAIYLSGFAASLTQAVESAKESLSSGRAAEKLASLSVETNKQ